MTYELEGDNVLKQVIKQRDGKIAYFRREFGEKETKMVRDFYCTQLKEHGKTALLVSVFARDTILLYTALSHIYDCICVSEQKDYRV